MKHEWRKHEKDIYVPKKKPEIIDVQNFKYITITGKGNPNEDEFAKKVEVLYSLAYAIKMMPKKGYILDGYFEYTVYPLEGLWDLTDEGKKLKELNKDCLVYKIMIRQPDFVTEEVLELAKEQVRKKKPNLAIDNVNFEEIKDGLSVQMLHLGSYDNEETTFKEMKKFIEENNLEIASLVHREIYLSDARKVSAEKLKTVLRYRVNKRQINL
ncbi:GyrI-like domain-containing protein [Clostridium thermobutyricum]|uniref:GyrI-like domain-containing protein n=1 Tax=Clostridium thermobutyricum TaxID=29372 RepID=UPI0018AB8FF1|nr:GyrI-like domain-containing protein [Clostridium thermobutyricum]